MVTVKEVVLERSFPVGPKFEMQKIRVTLDSMDGVDDLLQILDNIVNSYHNKNGIPEELKLKVSSNTIKESSVVKDAAPKDNTQRISEVTEVIPEEFKGLVKLVYVASDQRVCVQFKYVPPSEFKILADFMKDTLKAEYISAGKETYWKLP